MSLSLVTSESMALKNAPFINSTGSQWSQFVRSLSRTPIYGSDTISNATNSTLISFCKWLNGQIKDVSANDRVLAIPTQKALGDLNKISTGLMKAMKGHKKAWFIAMLD